MDVQDTGFVCSMANKATKPLQSYLFLQELTQALSMPPLYQLKSRM